jgi:hypothetical protein
MIKKNRISGVTKLSVSPESIPILIPKPALDAIGDGYEFVEILDYPQKGFGGTYNEGVFADVLESLKTRPIPGDKRGHSDSPNDDFFVIGASMENGATSFRVRVPENDYDGNSNDGFIRSLKTGNQKLSLVVDVEDNWSGQFDRLKSDKGLRNDAVGTLPAMQEQTVLANKENSLLALVERGKICEIDSAELVVDGRVNLTAVRNITPHDNPMRIRLMNAASKKKSNTKGKPKMDEKEIQEMINEMINKSIKEAAPTLLRSVLDAQAKEAETKKNVADVQTAQKIIEFAKEALGEDFTDMSAEEILDALKTLITTAEESAAEAEANSFVGDGLRKNTDGKDSALFIHAREEFRKMGRDIFKKPIVRKKHEELKENSIILELRRNAYNPVKNPLPEMTAQDTF